MNSPARFPAADRRAIPDPPCEMGGEAWPSLAFKCRGAVEPLLLPAGRRLDTIRIGGAADLSPVSSAG